MIQPVEIFASFAIAGVSFCASLGGISYTCFCLLSNRSFPCGKKDYNTEPKERRGIPNLAWVLLIWIALVYSVYYQKPVLRLGSYLAKFFLTTMGR
jgi:hypothetical protein